MRDVLDDHVVLQSFSAALTTEAAVLDAAEGRFRERRFQRVDRHVARLEFLGKLVRVIGPVGEAVRGQAKGDGIGFSDAFLDRGDRVDHRQRPERLDLHDVRVVGHVRQHGGFEEVTLLANLMAAGEKVGAFGNRVFDQRGQRRRAALVGKRSHVDTVVEAVAHNGFGSDSCECGGELVEDTVVHKETRRRRADLAGIAHLANGADSRR